jgi:hypothetical protein
MLMPQPGELYYYPNYVFPDGNIRDKYVLLMGETRGGDWILARTTSKAHGRPQNPRCNHDNPYPSFYLDTAGGLLPLETWLVLDRLDDYDTISFSSELKAGAISLAGIIPPALFCQALDCAARADDTTREQEKTMKDLRHELGCS